MKLFRYIYLSNTIKLKLYKLYYNMHHEEELAGSMLFNYETTNKTDYRRGDFHEYPKTVYKPKPVKDKRGAPVYKDIHTLTTWKADRPPFNLLHKLKDVVRTNPNNVQQPFDELVDQHREEVQKTRPRLIMTPAVSIDDITDPDARNLLIADMYLSDTTRTQREAVTSIKYNNIKAPFPGRAAPSNPIFLPKLQPPLVSPEWRMETVTWDERQLRGYCDSTKRFWLEQELPECKMCKETEAVRVHRKMLRDLKRGKR